MWRNRHPYYNAEGGGGGGADPAGTAGNTPAPGGEAPAGAAGGTPGIGDWFSGLSEGHRNDPTIGKFAGRPLDDLVTAHLNATKLIGVQPDQIVRLDEAQKDPTALLRRLGAPEKADGYKLTPPEGVPEHLATGENLGWFQGVAAEAGLLPAQAEKLYSAYVARNVEVQKAAEAAVAKAQDTLQREWGQAYDENIKAASSAARTLGLTAKLNDAGLGADPDVIKALVGINKMLAGRGDDAPGSTVHSTLPPAEARAKGKDLLRQAGEAHKAGRVEEAKRLSGEAQRYYAMAAA